MKRHIILIVLILSSSVLIAKDVNSVDSTDTEVVVLTKQIEKLEHTIKVLKKQNRSLKLKNRKLLQLCRQNNIDTKTQPEQEAITEEKIGKFCSPLEVGKKGWVDSIYPVQIQDSNNLLANITLERKFYQKPPYSPAPKKLVWIKGVDTTNRADNQSFKYDKIMQITGTKTYPTTTGGQTTVFVLEPVQDQTQINTDKTQ